MNTPGTRPKATKALIGVFVIWPPRWDEATHSRVAHSSEDISPSNFNAIFIDDCPSEKALGNRSSLEGSINHRFNEAVLKYFIFGQFMDKRKELPRHKGSWPDFVLSFRTNCAAPEIAACKFKGAFDNLARIPSPVDDGEFNGPHTTAARYPHDFTYHQFWPVGGVKLITGKSNGFSQLLQLAAGSAGQFDCESGDDSSRYCRDNRRNNRCVVSEPMSKVSQL
jgi:hypothetical protein